MIEKLSAALRKRARFMRPILERAGAVYPASFGLNGLDRKLLKYVSHRNGVFVEAGANDGLTQSNTAYFERYLGWRGLLVEPIPELATQCRTNRPRSIVEEYALVDESEAGMNVEMTYCNLMSFVAGARGSAEADGLHLNNGRMHLAQNVKPRKLTVPTATLTQLLERNGIGRVDVLSLDVEGFESKVLRGLDLKIVAPRWILVEANDPTAVDAELRERYQLVDQLSHHDRLYRLTE